jgi:hypothetical protein
MHRLRFFFYNSTGVFFSNSLKLSLRGGAGSSWSWRPSSFEDFFFEAHRGHKFWPSSFQDRASSLCKDNIFTVVSKSRICTQPYYELIWTGFLPDLFSKAPQGQETFVHSYSFLESLPHLHLIRWGLLCAETWIVLFEERELCGKAISEWKCYTYVDSAAVHPLYSWLRHGLLLLWGKKDARPRSLGMVLARGQETSFAHTHSLFPPFQNCIWPGRLRAARKSTTSSSMKLAWEGALWLWEVCIREFSFLSRPIAKFSFLSRPIAKACAAFSELPVPEVLGCHDWEIQNE